VNEKGWRPKIVAFVCNWCTYAGADLAGTVRLSYSPEVLLIRVPCSGRVTPFMVLKAFERGADAVLISGCHPGDCHYGSGNYLARRRFHLFKQLMEFVGINPNRLWLSWVSASEGGKFANLIDKMVNEIKSLGKFNYSMEETKGEGTPKHS